MSQRRSGITILGQLIAVALAATLCAVLSPVYVRARMNGASRTCQSNMRHLSQAMLAYSDDWHGSLPAWALPNKDGNTTYPKDKAMTWDAVIRPYMSSKDPKVISCPTDPTGEFWHVQHGWVPGRSYSYPSNMGGGWSPYMPEGRQVASIPVPELTVMLVERPHGNNYDAWDGCAVTLTLSVEYDIAWQRHNGFANFAYADSHVSSLRCNPGKGPSFPGYNRDANGAAVCNYNDPIPKSR